VPVEKMANMLLLPTRALMQPGGSPFVYVLGRDGFERRPVTVARRGQTQVAIAKGLEEGERVALENPEKAQ
jgi:hypothetical protein